jgi:hypothetical protein
LRAGGANFRSSLPSVSARDLKAASATLLGGDEERNALHKLIPGIELWTLVLQAFNDISQSPIGKRRPMTGDKRGKPRLIPRGSELQRALLKQRFPDFLVRSLS